MPDAPASTPGAPWNWRWPGSTSTTSRCRLPYQDNLSALIHEPTFRQTVGDALFTKARLIKDLGNLAVHSTRKMAPSGCRQHATRELFHFCYWLARTYGRTARPTPA